MDETGSVQAAFPVAGVQQLFGGLQSLPVPLAQLVLRVIAHRPQDPAAGIVFLRQDQDGAGGAVCGELIVKNASLGKQIVDRGHTVRADGGGVRPPHQPVKELRRAEQGDPLRALGGLLLHAGGGLLGV